MINTENKMATARVTTEALAFMLDLPQEITITDVEITSVDEEEQILMLHLEGTHPVSGEELEDVEYALQYTINSETNAPELVGIEPLNTESS